jgi:hypothetical protein
MARLLIKTEGFGRRRWNCASASTASGASGVRFPINHATVSTHHCELVLSNDGVCCAIAIPPTARSSTATPVAEAWLMPGQQVRLGDVELFVESTEVNIAIPQFERPSRPPPPVVLPDGAILPARAMPQSARDFKCTHCNEIMCRSCTEFARTPAARFRETFRAANPDFFNRFQTVGHKRRADHEQFFLPSVGRRGNS